MSFTLSMLVCPPYSVALTGKLSAPPIFQVFSQYQSFLVSLHHTGAEGWRGGGGEEGETEGIIWGREIERVDGRWGWCDRWRHQPQWAARAERPRRRRQGVWVGLNRTQAYNLKCFSLYKQPFGYKLNCSCCLTSAVVPKATCQPLVLRVTCLVVPGV